MKDSRPKKYYFPSTENDILTRLQNSGQCVQSYMKTAHMKQKMFYKQAVPSSPSGDRFFDGYQIQKCAIIIFCIWALQSEVRENMNNLIDKDISQTYGHNGL